VATSRVLTGAVAVAAGLLAAGLSAESAVDLAGRLLVRALSAPAGLEPDVGGAAEESLRILGRLALPPAAAACAAAMAAGLVQTRGLLAPGALRWRTDRLDPVAGLRRLASPAAAVDGLLRAAQALLALALGALTLAGLAPALAAAPSLGAGGAGAVVFRTARAAAGLLLATLAAAGGADLFLSRWRHARTLRMTRPEVARDLREEEGDPWLRAQRRRSHAALLASGSPPRPVCVVVNPTRLAVALGHRRGSDEAPVVLAKRAGAAAGALRRRARRSGLPVVRDPALARALWSLAEVGESIPEELYEAAAALLASVYALSGEART
jgi:flagellar biosynthesis protein FlhB